MASHVAGRLRQKNHNPSVIELLQAVSLFRQLSAEQLATIAKRGRFEQAAKNQIIFAEGLPPDNFYLILSGSVQLSKREVDDTVIELAVLRHGELLGLLSVMDGAPRSATASTLEPCELLVFERQELFRILADFPQLLPEVLSRMAGKVRTDRTNFFSERKKLRVEMARERYRSVAQALAATNKAKSVEEAIQIVVDQICLQTGWPVGHAYIVEGDSGEGLVSSNAWHLRDPKRFEPFRKLSDATRLLPGVGLPGRVLATGVPLWIADLQEALHPPRAGVARTLGLRTGFAFPILLEDRVVAVLEFFSDQQTQADELLLEAMTSIGTQLGRIIESKRYEEQLLHNALHDPLTDLPNRALFLESLKQSLARLQRHKNYLFAVLFIDLDRFKVVNDSLGHVIGDRLLVEIARRIQACLRPMDVVARLGGDEYAILLDDIKSVTDASRTVERIRAKLQVPLTLSGREVYTSASIGIAMSSRDYERPEHLLRDADTAMYRAKAEGKGQYKVFDVSMHAHAMKQLQLENDMRRAIDRGEFRMNYQPIVSLETGRIVAFEALVRWMHPERGLLPPDEFIRLAEETELIIPLTHWILQEACSEVKKWQALIPKGSPLSVSVNLSSKHLAKPSIIEEIAGVLAKNELGAHSLTVEITESQLMENAEALSQILARLSKMGIKISIDDFGTGYSSLSYLSGFRVHALKIDRNFVSKLKDDEKNAAIVRAIVSLGRNLGLEVIAEGVETAKQLDYLRDLKCLYGQGYYFFFPMQPDEAAASLVRDLSMQSERKVRISRLCSFDLFDGLSQEELAEIAHRSKELPVPAGTVIFDQGQPSEQIYLMEQGSLGIHRTEAGVSQFLGVLEAPAFLGEMSLLNPGRTWTARVKALSDLRLLTIPVSDCISYLQRSASFRNNLEQLTAGRNSI